MDFLPPVQHQMATNQTNVISIGATWVGKATLALVLALHVSTLAQRPRLGENLFLPEGERERETVFYAVILAPSAVTTVIQNVNGGSPP